MGDGPVRAQPTNDLFANRIVKTGNSWSETGTNTDATMESGEPIHFSQLSGGTGRSVWWTWTAPEAGVVSLDTYPSSNSSAVGVYQGTSVSALALVTKSFSTGFPNGASRVNFEVGAGASFQIAVDGYSSPFSFGLNLDLAPLATNDAFASRIFLGGTSNRVRAHNLLCTTEPGEPVPPGGGPSRSCWWSWTAPTNGLVTVDVLARGFATRVTIYTGEGLSSLTSVASASFAERTSGSCTFMATQGVNYVIGVDAPVSVPGLSISHYASLEHRKSFRHRSTSSLAAPTRANCRQSSAGRCPLPSNGTLVTNRFLAGPIPRSRSMRPWNRILAPTTCAHPTTWARSALRP